MEIKLLLATTNGSLHWISFFFVLPTYVETIFMRSLHNPVVTKLCKMREMDFIYRQYYIVSPKFDDLTPRNILREGGGGGATDLHLTGEVHTKSLYLRPV